MTENSPSRELTPAPPQVGGTVQPFIPRTAEEIKWTVGMIIGAGLAPDSYNNDAKKVAVGIMKGMEVGLAPLSALANIAIINGRPSIWGDGAVALVQAKGLVKKLQAAEIGVTPDEGTTTEKFPDDYGYEVTIWRKGQDEPYVGRFTVGDAKRAKLWMNPKRAPWMLYPRRMLMNRARLLAIRDGFADALAGLSIREEVEDLPASVMTSDVTYLDDDLGAGDPDATRLKPPQDEPDEASEPESEAPESEGDPGSAGIRSRAGDDELFGGADDPTMGAPEITEGDRSYAAGLIETINDCKTHNALDRLMEGERETMEGLPAPLLEEIESARAIKVQGWV